MSPNHPILAPELMDMIIDFLHDDPVALKNCSLTCTSWVPTCRLHLFDTIQLQEKRLKSFHTILQFSPHIGPYVKFLHVELSEPEDPELFTFIVPHLTSLEDLDIYAVENSLVPWDSLATLAMTVVRLHVEAREAFEGPWDLVRLIRLFPKIKRFSVYDRGEPEITIESVYALAGALNGCRDLNILDLQFCHLAVVFTGILRIHNFDALDTLLFQSCCTDEWDAFPNLLTAKAKTWKNVTLILGDLHQADEHCIGETGPVIHALCACTSLRRLRFIAAHHTLEPLKALLSSSTLSKLARQLTELHVELEFINEMDMGRVDSIINDLRDIVAMLKHDRWKALSSGKITVITKLTPVKDLVLSNAGELQKAQSKLKMRHISHREP
ncbi:hypothetical protein CERSUDRAFT_96665 [Gelatoporia subvermispora B]|uniref:F-box domain-containing protein n=1 Tax=Ceriporiopsis subvermispora (strain B) TaxID=914234 RepID=M2RAV8_CERS8|nr:hypothetical protein CERSUDRAFT_96665 [Gelatoporia subvermispora B]